MVSNMTYEAPTARSKPARPAAMDLGFDPVCWRHDNRPDTWVFALPVERPPDGPDPLTIGVGANGTGRWCWHGDETLDGTVLRCCGLEWPLQYDESRQRATAPIDRDGMKEIFRGLNY